MGWKPPWKKRVEVEHEHRIEAEQRLADVEADWPRVLRETAALDAFNTKARDLFGGHP